MKLITKEKDLIDYIQSLYQRYVISVTRGNPTVIKGMEKNRVKFLINVMKLQSGRIEAYVVNVDTKDKARYIYDPETNQIYFIQKAFVKKW